MTDQEPLLPQMVEREVGERSASDPEARGSSATPDQTGTRPSRAQQIIRRGTVHAKEVAKKGYEKSRLFIINQYTKFKEDPKRGPRFLTWVSVAACVILIPGLFFDIITLALTLSPMDVLADIYAALGCVLLISAEFSRISARFGVRSMIHFYIQFIEFTAGRGLVQMFVASLCVSVKDLLNLFKFIPGLALLLCGVLNVIWGLYAACKLNTMMAKMREYDGEEFQSKTMAEKLDLLDRKFELLNKRGDGLLTVDDLREGVKEMNLMINEVELKFIFEALDEDHDGLVSKEEFETWWLREKGPKFL
ncbi:EF hand domain-containing protein [Toxoplasma gondii TgCatPRC2]|uniref:EF hand domain-containing protein n=15 Tax=Toxoplasma gondii TaxID=5811 RepID=A0A125YVX3_TOXGV|nr:EF hand domain-containing protein [Toxoplasma gondii ME49]EPR61291.1 EF hand domain-containing protein [Toxoplasma gondii GT1]ESS33346.1 EF hand domain-containing protein [Toxoplasma gondii VEG]KAF4642567.1 EF hand domain-containing protein [Toxoplasma gondii]KFG28541.1 EF hand domain-containing protein [Toxoplasma gondii p89]KFG32290.1 EF hand domain-containing protein [Toxoplasma gondii GAB2-2007-GAL-DOM2]KFG36281.1 EF hand domain-containing protein [Toxoplasma gondii FOU]KFG57345.1 EF |eukprot:XP_018637216.1 EF hand domain-containing protein [Toxoplasma gondii ME49]